MTANQKPPSSDHSVSFLAKAERWMPGLRIARTYQVAWLVRDLVAGLVLSALLVPQGMAYAELAGLPAITGLYATVICLLAYAVFGPSPYLVLRVWSIFVRWYTLTKAILAKCAPFTERQQGLIILSAYSRSVERRNLIRKGE